MLKPIPYLMLVFFGVDFGLVGWGTWGDLGFKVLGFGFSWRALVICAGSIFEPLPHHGGRGVRVGVYDSPRGQSRQQN